MNITLEEIRVAGVNFAADAGPDEVLSPLPLAEGKSRFKLDFYPQLAEGDTSKRAFAILFDCKIDGVAFKQLSVHLVARFSTDEDYDDKFKDSAFLNINAPAIAYPYLRATASQLILLCGYKPVTLPTINFVALRDQRKADSEKALGVGENRLAAVEADTSK